MDLNKLFADAVYTGSATTAPSLADLLETMTKIPRPYLPQASAMVAHPENLAILRKEGAASIAAEAFGYSVPVIENADLPKFSRRWQFPSERFIEYEKSDERWAIPLGFGKWVETTERAFYFIRNLYPMVDFRREDLE